MRRSIGKTPRPDWCWWARASWSRRSGTWSGKRAWRTEGSECIILPDGVDAVIRKCDGVTGIRDIEQAAEHIVAHALYQIEVNHVQSVTFDGAMIEELLS